MLPFFNKFKVIPQDNTPLISREQLIQIAEAGFPDQVKQFLEFEHYDIFHLSGVYRLYDVRKGYCIILPTETIFSIDYIPKNKFVQFNINNSRAFNHYAALKEMQKLKLI